MNVDATSALVTGAQGPGYLEGLRLQDVDDDGDVDLFSDDKDRQLIWRNAGGHFTRSAP